MDLQTPEPEFGCRTPDSQTPEPEPGSRTPDSELSVDSGPPTKSGRNAGLAITPAGRRPFCGERRPFCEMPRLRSDFSEFDPCPEPTLATLLVPQSEDLFFFFFFALRRCGAGTAPHFSTPGAKRPTLAD